MPSSLPANVSDAGSAAALVAAVEREFGRLDVLVNMASLYQEVAFDALDEAAWRRQLGVDLDGTFFCVKAAVPLMRRSGGGRIINFADWVAASGRPRYPGYVAYYVAKAGVKALTEALALELAPDRILVNAIAPGPILAPPGTSPAEIDGGRQGHAARPMGRRGRDREGGAGVHRIRLHHRRDASGSTAAGTCTRRPLTNATSQGLGFSARSRTRTTSMSDHPKIARTDHDILDVIRMRWSPRAFDPEKDVSVASLAALFEAARWAPSSLNEQPWRFVVADRGVDPLTRLSRSSDR